MLVAANVYLQALAAAARADSARAQLQTADALFRQAGDLKESGLVAGIDVLRAEVQLDTERQRATAAQNDFEKAKLQLARVIGLPIGQPFTLSDELPPVPVPDMTLDQALERAYAARPDYQAALERVQAAEAAREAIRRRGASVGSRQRRLRRHWLTPGTAKGTYSLVGSVNVPIFRAGGRRTAGRGRRRPPEPAR